MERMRSSCAVLSTTVLLLAGCAAGRTVVETTLEAGANPLRGHAVRIESVEDACVFSAAPPQADMPSLMNAEEITDKAITSRAVARKRGGFGAALGDMLLPEGDTVQRLSRTAVTRAFRESGYRVLAPGDPGYERATHVHVRIEEFLSWFSPGFASVAVNFRGKLRLLGAIPPIEKGQSYSAAVQDRMQAVFESDWAAIVSKGVEALVAAVRQGLGRAATP